MISINKAISIIQASIKQSKTENIDVFKALGRVLAKPIKSMISSPPFDMSSMDGYAVKFNNKKNKNFKLLNEVYAGDKNEYEVNNQQAIRVFTGSKIPKGTSQVIIQEKVKQIADDLISFKSLKSQENYIRKKGQDYKKGTILLQKKHQLGARDIGLLISSGIKMISVYKKPNIAIISTGNELVAPNFKLKNNQIYASSMYMLKQMLYLVCTDCEITEIVKDNEKLIKDKIRSLQNIDLLITTGGVSVGKKDLVKKCLEDLGMKKKFWRVKIKPGKPILFGVLKNMPIFGLPGNSVSSYICFMIFVLEAIKKMNSLKPEITRKGFGILENDINNKGLRDAFFRGKFTIKKNKKLVKIFPNQDSSLMKILSSSNCLVKVRGNTFIKKNSTIEIIELCGGI